ncbi:MAG: S9 family peptidase [Lewinellaceae bacterium]|nr:S9 family peptidase [Lewinellaceae bacterium]
MKNRILRCSLLAACLFFLVLGQVGAQNSLSLAALKSYPFPNELTASATGSRIAWAFNESGLRNIYVAEGPSFAARRLTSYQMDDGQELTSVSVSADGNWVVYLRGGDHGSNWDDGVPVNPTFTPTPPKVQIWSVPFTGGEPNLIGEGENPTISPRSDQIVFERNNQLWTAPVDGSAAAKQLFSARGNNGSAVWSPDGSRLAFRSNRGDHSFIGVFTNAETPIQWIAPSFHRDESPRWSPTGDQLCFVRMPGGGGAPDSVLVPRHQAWGIYVADLANGQTRRIWQAPPTLRGSVPSTHGGTNLHWAANRIVFLSYHDGWPHLYSLDPQGEGKEAMLLTAGNFMAEHISLSPDRKWLVFAGNTGPDPLDIDRRHVVRVPVDRPAMQVMTPGSGLEWSPVVTATGDLVFISATTQRPPIPATMPMAGGPMRLIAQERIPQNFPASSLVTPKQVIFQAADGVTVHAQWFERNDGRQERKPAIVYIHGGPPRQMLLGWHYSDYYANAYAENQYLASQGFIVLSVNYRLGIGYGYEFHRPADGGTNGASEYRDIKAAGEWLARQPQVDPARIGVYGGSYGGYLTAMALGKDSRLFAAGVDIHGVHDRTSRTRNLLLPESYERAPDAEQAARVAWESSPIAWVSGWTSPVLIIHGDDDRNVRFSQSVDLVQRLEAKGVPLETMVVVDDTHHFMLHANAVKVDAAISDFFVRRFKPAK